jgi:hypothetical protein
MSKLALLFAAAFAVGAFSLPARAGQIGDFDDVVVDDTFDDADGSPAVPEPGAALAMGAGLAAIAFALRRRR